MQTVELKIDEDEEVIPVVCSACGSDHVGQIDSIVGYALIQGVRLDGDIVWSGETEMEWNSQQLDSNPPEHICLACGAKVDLKTIIGHAVQTKKEAAHVDLR